jgi:hypothetical protein
VYVLAYNLFKKLFICLIKRSVHIYRERRCVVFVTHTEICYRFLNVLVDKRVKLYLNKEVYSNMAFLYSSSNFLINLVEENSSIKKLNQQKQVHVRSNNPLLLIGIVKQPNLVI